MEKIYSNRTITVCFELDLDHLNLILYEAIALFSSDEELIEMARLKSRHLSAIYQKKEKLTEDDLDQICTILETFLSSTSVLPAPVVAHVHTYIGLIRQHQERYDCAIDSLLKALWVRTSAQEPADHIAVASHRLGLAYGLASNVGQASSLLQKALQHYQEAHVPRDHGFVLSAKQNFEKYEARKVLLKLLVQSKTLMNTKQLSQNHIDVDVSQLC
jgi:tetratricopeptide (TPR) repeat protein